jgi:hypothetical protein
MAHALALQLFWPSTGMFKRGTFRITSPSRKATHLSPYAGARRRSRASPLGILPASSLSLCLLCIYSEETMFESTRKAPEHNSSLRTRAQNKRYVRWRRWVFGSSVLALLGSSRPSFRDETQRRASSPSAPLLAQPRTIRAQERQHEERCQRNTAKQREMVSRPVPAIEHEGQRRTA